MKRRFLYCEVKNWEKSIHEIRSEAQTTAEEVLEISGKLAKKEKLRNIWVRDMIVDES